MPSSHTSVVILCEDIQQDVFARKYLKEQGVIRQRITSKVCPPGKKSGEQYVREVFPQELKTLRQKAREDRALIVFIDADMHSVQDRFEQLNEALNNANQKHREDADRVGIFIPKRNIETWIMYGHGQSVDEVTSYPKLNKESDCRDAVHQFVNRICVSPLSADAPPSLHQACREIKRVL